MICNREELDWEKMEGLLPAVIQDVRTLQVLMVGYVNREALRVTEESGKMTFFSRSKKRLWTKGESSGNFLEVIDIKVDCDGDCLLVKAIPHGPTCHRETPSCFSKGGAEGVGFLGQLERVIESRKEERPRSSYTTRLFEDGLNRIARKVGEESIEAVVAALGEEGRLEEEVADLIYHVIVLLQACDTNLDKVIDLLKKRHQ